MSTTTEEPGCCRGFSYKAQDKCVPLLDQTGCERKDCEWLLTADPKDCVITTTTTTTTTTTEEPGCCKGDSPRTNDRCNKMEGRERCERSSSCHFLSGGVLEVDCVVESTTTEPGCCYINPDAAHSKRWQESCTAFYTEKDCLMLTNADGVSRCVFEPLGEGYDCSQLWPTTTTTTEEPGCCRGYSYKAQAKCVGLEDQTACERKDCEWLLTDDEKDCELTTTTTTTTTTTVAPGCCKADSAKRQDMCDMKDTQSKCDRSSSCTWLFGDDPALCEHPATTTENPGCCYGDTVASNEMCAAFDEDPDKCDTRSQCVFRSGKDADCTLVFTTTTEEPGCCYGDTPKTNEMCGAKVGRDQCERSGKCEFRAGENADCELPTTTEEPWLNAKSEMRRKRAKGANAQHQQQALLFGGESSVVTQAMQTQVSLSSVLLFVLAAFALQQAYVRCFSGDGKKQIRVHDARATYQSL